MIQKEEDQGEEWEIEKILKKRVRKEKACVPMMEYLIKWKNFDDTFNDWKTRDELYDLVVPDFENHIFIFENRPKSKKKTTKQEKNTKWNEALINHERTSNRDYQYIRERIQIERQLENEARLVAQEAERLEAQNLSLFNNILQTEKNEIKRKKNAEKRYCAIKDIYSPLGLPLEEVKEEPKIKVRARVRSRVPSLWSLCIRFVCDNITLYDGFENVPIMWKANMFYELSRKKLLSVEKFEILLDPLQKYLDLSICRKSVTSQFMDVLEKSPQLNSLTLTHCPQFYFPWIKALRCCTNLQKLVLSGCYNLANLEGLQECQALKELDLSGCIHLCSGNPEAAVSLLKLTNLETLSLTGDFNLPISIIPAILQHLPLLENLFANYAAEYIPYDISERKNTIKGDPILENKILSRNLKILHWIAFKSKFNQPYISCYHQILNYIFNKEGDFPNFPILEEIAIGWCIPGLFEPWSLLKLHPQLKGIVVNFMDGKVNSDVRRQKINHFPDFFPGNLSKIEFHFGSCLFVKSRYSNQTYIDVSSQALNQLVCSEIPLKILKITGLEKASIFLFLKLWKNQFFHFSELDITQWGSSIISVPKFEKFWLLPSQITWNTIPLPRHVALTRLTLENVFWIDEEIFPALFSSQTCPNLEYLNIIGLPVYSSNKTIQYILNSFPKLTSLSIGGPINDNTITAISNGEIIKTLVIKFSDFDMVVDWGSFFESFPRLKNMTLAPLGKSSFEVNTGKLFNAINRNRNLSFLQINGYKWGLADFESFSKHIKHLEILKLVGCSVNSLSDLDVSTNCQILIQEEDYNNSYI